MSMRVRVRIGSPTPDAKSGGGGACVRTSKRANTIYLYAPPTKKNPYDICATLGHETLHLVVARIDLQASICLDGGWALHLLDGWAYDYLYPSMKDKCWWKPE